MSVGEFALEMTTEKTVSEAVAAVEAALSERKFSVLWHLHINEKLAEKGLTLDPDIHILEVCSAPKAKQAIEANPGVAYFLPCKVVVQRQGGRTSMGLVKPTALMGILGDEQLGAFAAEVEAVLTEALQAAR